MAQTLTPREQRVAKLLWGHSLVAGGVLKPLGAVSSGALKPQDLDPAFFFVVDQRRLKVIVLIERFAECDRVLKPELGPRADVRLQSGNQRPPTGFFRVTEKLLSDVLRYQIRARQLGLVNFQNAFLRRMPDGKFEEVINPLAADAIDNQRYLPAQVAVTRRYDVPVDRQLKGQVRIHARLRYRAFPPELLRVLAVREPQLVNESLIDRNDIIDMANAQTSILVMP